MGDNDSSQPAILLAHGDTRQLKSLTDLLCEEGYSILSATDGETALHIAQTYPLLLILLDVVKAGVITSRLRIGCPSKTNSKEQKFRSVGKQTPTKLRQDQVTPSPTNKRRLPNAGRHCAGCSQSHFR